jgi:DNA-binding LacI/PurR family transcriptional regulator
VSYALNGNPGLSEPTRQRILAVAAEAGWQPNRAARALSASRSGACGLALARPARTLAYEPFFSKLLSGIEAELSARQVALMLQIVEDVEAETVALRRWWAERHVDGVLLVDLRVEDPRVPQVEQLHLPTVIVGGPGATGAVPYFPGNDTSGIRQIVEHLAALGHRRIDRVAGSNAFACTRVRNQVLEEALATAGAHGRVLPTDYTSSAGADATRKLLAATPRPTAIIYDNDIMAVAGLGVAQEMGLVVPTELSVVSFDDSILCEVVRPSLTACARDVEAYGARAARALLDLLEGQSVPQSEEEPTSLVPRASTAVVPA